jgi:lipopolysaccharide transport system permease protein
VKIVQDSTVTETSFEQEIAFCAPYYAVRRVITELWRFRGLVWALTQRHLATRYRGSVLGFLWSILNPLSLMAVYVLVFHYYMKSSMVDDYPIFLFCGLLPWVWTSSALAEGTSSIASSGHLITKSIFPPQILPYVAVQTTLVNLLLSLPLLVVLMVWWDRAVPITALLLPFVLALHLTFLFGATLLLSSLNVLYRDVQHLVGSLLGFLFFLSPIVYPASIIPAHLQWTLTINPFALFTEVYHAVLFSGQLPSGMQLLSLMLWSGATLIVGAVVFERQRESFAELL